MNTDNLGLPTLHTRVESWESDFIGHWNTRFYARSFQLASEVAMLAGGGANPGAALISSRHIRFHHELLTGAPVEVRSMVLSGGFHDGAVAHVLSSRGRLSATALDLYRSRPGVLPRVPTENIAQALPRGISGALRLPWDEDNPANIRAELGIVRPSGLDHTGALLFEELIRFVTGASYDQMSRLGYDLEFMESTGVGRMLVELRTTLLGSCAAGDRITASSRVVSVGEKFFTTAHCLRAGQGTPLALIEMGMLAVDMKTRRAATVPDIMRRLVV